MINYTDDKGKATSATVAVDQSDPMNMGAWVKIGSSYFNPTSVVLQNTATPEPPPTTGGTAKVPGDYVVVADAVMFVPDTIEGLGYSSPVTDADVKAGELATNVFAMSITGRAMAFDVNPIGPNKVAHLNWIYPAVRTKMTPKPEEMDKPSWGDIGASLAFINTPLHPNKLYVATLDGTVRCLNNVKPGPPSDKVEDGGWVFPGDTNPGENPGGFTSSPALSSPDLYIGSTNGIFYALDLESGKLDWKYPADDPTALPGGPPTTTPPLGAFRYSTPAVGVASSGGGTKRVWCGSSDGHIYSFLAEKSLSGEQRIWVETKVATDGTQTQIMHPIGMNLFYSEPSLLSPIQGSVALDGASAAGNSTMYVGDMKGTLHWRDADNGSTNDWLYAGWTTPDMLFSSPNITNTTVTALTVPVSWIYIGCADGHLLAFTHGGANSAWGGYWQGGDWPFPGSEPNSNASKTTAAPETDIQFDIFSQKFFNDTLSFNPEPAITPISPATTVDELVNWPCDRLVSKAMKIVPSGLNSLALETELRDQAKYRRQTKYLPVGRDASNELYFEWGESINMAVWNLPEQKYLYGGGGQASMSAITITMTNASAGESAGSQFVFKGKIRALTYYSVLENVGGVYSQYLEPSDSKRAGEVVKRSYALASIDIDGTTSNPPSPGPGWVISVDIKKKDSNATDALVTSVTIPLAKLRLLPSAKKDPCDLGSNNYYYEPLLVITQKGGLPDTPKEVSLGINNPLAITDNPSISARGLGWGTGLHPKRDDETAHLNGNAIWTTNTSGGFDYIPGPTPTLDMALVPHGTSSREAPLGVMDRSAVGMNLQNKHPVPQITKFRIDSADLTFRGGQKAIECASGQPGIAYCIKFPLDYDLGSIDYPDIYRRYQTYQQVSSNYDASNTQCPMLAIADSTTPPTLPPPYEGWWLRPDTLLVSVDVPRFQPANVSPPDPNTGLGGYSKTMTAYIDSASPYGQFNSGNVVHGAPTTFQEAYRNFRVGLRVPPDPKIEVDEQLIDVGSAPHGLGVNTTGNLAFSAYNSNPEIQQWFKKITIKNAGNVNLYNIRINQGLDLVSDQAGSGASLPGDKITSSLDPVPLLSPFGSAPFVSTGKNADGGYVFLGYTLSKPRVGDPDPTIMTVPDRRKWDVEYSTRSTAATAIMSAGWPEPADPDKQEPLPVEVSVWLPLTQPIGTYQSWDRIDRTPYVAVYSDIPNSGILERDTAGYFKVPVAMPSFQLKATVRENQLTGGATPTTLPQIDHMPQSAEAPPDLLPSVGDATPAAFRDAAEDKLGVHLFWSSNGSSDRTGPYPADDAERAKLAGAPWFINHAVLGYGNKNWSAADPFHWWTTPGTRIPAEQWPVPGGGSLASLNIMPWSGSGADALYSVRHYSPCIGENLAVARTADANRTWLAWAGTADVRDPATNKISQLNSIFYTDATHGVDRSTGSTPKIWGIQHDATMVKRNPYPVPDGNNMWMFWQGGSSGNWSIYYSYSNGWPLFDTTVTATTWSPDMKLRTPDCMASVGSPNALLRHWWANLRSANETDFPDAYRGILSNSKKVFDVVYSSTSKITHNADIMLSRYIAMSPAGDPNLPPSVWSKMQPSQVAQPMPRVLDEKLMRDPKFGFYTSKHLVWVRFTRGQTPGIDRWGHVSDPMTGPDFPYVHVVFPEGYDGVTPALPAGTEISATDGGAIVRDPATGTVKSVIDLAAAITPEIDDATGIYTYKYPATSAAYKVLGQMLVDFSSGIVRFTQPLKEVQITTGPKKGAYISPEVHADYTPQAWRITTDSAADSSPRAFIEHTSMTGTQIDGSKLVPGLDPAWSLSKPAPVDRMWVLWSKTGTAVDSSTIFYTTMRIGVDLTKLGLLPIPMDPLKGTILPSAKLSVNTPRGPWEVDRTGTKVYFSEVDERYRSMITPGSSGNSGYLGTPPPDMTIQYDDAKGNPQQKTLYDVSWITELPEQSLFGFAADANVNEGSIYAFADPQPTESGTSVRLMSSKIWVFWTSTRGGNSDLFWETLSPNFWAR